MCPRRVYSPSLLEHKALLSSLKDRNELKKLFHQLRQLSERRSILYYGFILTFIQNPFIIHVLCANHCVCYREQRSKPFFIVLMLASLSEGRVNQYVEQCLQEKNKALYGKGDCGISCHMFCDIWRKSRTLRTFQHRL